MRVFFFISFVFEKFSKQAKSAVIQRYEKCFILRLTAVISEYKKVSYFMLSQQCWGYFILTLD